MNINRIKLIKNSFLSVLTDWNRNYCFQEGFHSIIRCLLGILLIIFYNKKYKRSQVKIEFLTFSVIPNLTKIWLRNIKSLDIRHPFRITIGDCSGGLRKKNHDTKVKVFPIANIEHGEKLDLFINNICNAEFIVVCDDDIFFINPEGLNWAIKKLKNNKNLAVVTLAPRNHKTNWVRNTEFLMGSYCLVIRTKIWINEGLSFQQVKPKGWRKIGNFFDTADYANNQLIIKGYDIIKVSKRPLR